jgi:hypothetical protein
MSRFEEKKRIDQAIKHRNSSELQWALSYSQMRLKMATLKHHQKAWRRIERSILQALASK